MPIQQLGLTVKQNIINCSTY